MSRYTNAVLTVIAACLLVLVLKPALEPAPARAQQAGAPSGGVIDVNIVEIGGWKLLSRSALPVEIESGPVPVEIQGARKECGCP